MKVERKNEEFVPIVITLETKEEAELMKHIMNCGYCTPLEVYGKANNISVTDLNNIKCVLWHELSKRV